METDWLDRSEYPFASRFFDTEAGRMHYVDEGGAGRQQTLVMAHGTPEWSFSYRHLIKGLSARYRCIAPDYLGFGLSDKSRGWTYRPQDHARSLKALIDHLDLKDITLIVHDFGGPIGLSYAIERPDNVRRIVLMNTWMWSLRGDPAFERSRLFAGAVGRFLYERLGFSARFLLPMAMADKSKLTPTIHRHYLRPYSTPADRHATWVFARELLGSGDWYESLWQRRDRIRNHPALLLWGMKDFAFRAKELGTWQTALANARTIAFENTGHFVAEEQGATLCPLIEDFIENGPTSAEKAKP